MADLNIDIDLPTDIVRSSGTKTENHLPQWDADGKLKDGLATSQGGNESADAGKLAKYSSTGQLAAGVENGAAIRGVSSNDEGVHGTSATGTALYGNVTGADAIALRLTHQGATGKLIAAWGGGASNAFEVAKDGSISFPNGGSAPANTRSALGLGSAALQDSSAFDAAGSAAAAEAAAKTYAEGLAVGLLDDRGNYDASTNLYPSSGGSGTAGAILKGDLWRISVAGTLGGEAVDVGDSIRAITDTPGQTAGNWAKFEANVQQATESTRGTAMIATLAEVQDPASTNVLDIVTPSRMWRALLQTLPSQAEILSAVRGTLLDGLSLAAGTAITAADSVLSAFGKLQKQITDLTATVSGKITAPGSLAAGDLLYYDGSSWARVPAGTAGQRLTSAGTGAPVWHWAEDVMNVTGGNAITWTAMPSAVGFFQGQVTRHVYNIDLTHKTQIRIVVVMGGTAAANTGRLVLRYKTGAYSNATGDYADIGTGASEVAASCTTINVQTDSGWVDITADAKAEIQLALMGLGSNTSNNPVFGNVTIFTR